MKFAKIFFGLILIIGLSANLNFAQAAVPSCDNVIEPVPTTITLDDNTLCAAFTLSIGGGTYIFTSKDIKFTISTVNNIPFCVTYFNGTSACFDSGTSPLLYATQMTSLSPKQNDTHFVLTAQKIAPPPMPQTTDSPPPAAAPITNNTIKPSTNNTASKSVKAADPAAPSTKLTSAGSKSVSPAAANSKQGSFPLIYLYLAALIIVIGVIARFAVVRYLEKRKLREKIDMFEAQRSVLVNEKILKSSMLLLEDEAGKGEELIQRIGAVIQKEDIPHAVLSTREIRVLGGYEHKFLVVADNRLKGMEILIGAFDYGRRLEVRKYIIIDTPEEYAKRTTGYLYQPEQMLLEWRIITDKLGYMTSDATNQRLMEEWSNFVKIVDDIYKAELDNFIKGKEFELGKTDESQEARGFVNI